MKQSAVLLILAIVLFALGRFTAPEKIVEDKRKIDSLTQDLNQAQKRELVHKDSIRQLIIMSDTWFTAYEKEKNSKSVTHTVYDNRKKAIDVMPDSTLFREFLAVYPDK